jgi:hypothetical protein
MQKPTMKMEWRGQKGNMWRGYTVTNSDGHVMHFQSKADADRVFKASQNVYKKVTTYRKKHPKN